MHAYRSVTNFFKTIAKDTRRRNYSRRNPDKQDVHLVSHSSLFAIDKKTIEEAKFPLKVCLFPMWLEKVHSSHLDHEWGQTYLGFPKVFRDIFVKMHPNFPKEKFLRWKHILEVREQKISFLKEQHKQGNIILSDFRHENIADYEGRTLFSPIVLEDGKYTMRTRQGETVFEISQENLGTVFNFLSVPRISPFDLSKIGFKDRPHTELYQIPPSKVPRIIFVNGMGLSSIWIKKHFPNSEIMVLAINKGENLIMIPSNASVDYSQIKIVQLEDVTIPEDSEEIIEWVKIGDKKIYLKESYFTAIGYEPYEEITKIIPKDNLVTLSDIKGSWIAPQNIPKGSLTHRLMSELNLMLFEPETFFELQFFLENTTLSVLKDRAYQRDIEISVKFFNDIEVEIQKLADPMDEKGELNLYLKVFEKYHPTGQEKELFSELIQEMQNEIKQRNQYDDVKTTSLASKLKL